MVYSFIDYIGCGLQQHAVEYAAEKILLLKKFSGSHERWNVLSTAEIENTIEIESIESLWDKNPKHQSKGKQDVPAAQIPAAPAATATTTTTTTKKNEKKSKSKMCTIM